MSKNEFNPDWLHGKEDYDRILRETILEHKEVIDELISLNLWQARRLNHQQHKDFAYDSLEKITSQKYERL